MFSFFRYGALAASALACCASYAQSQIDQTTTNRTAVVAANDATTASPQSASDPTSDSPIETVTIRRKRLDAARNSLSPETGSSVYNINQDDIQSMPLGESTPMNQVLLQAPGVVQDSYGQIHVRGDHANVQYRIDGITLPESVSGFAQSLDAHFANDINLLTGALPAQYGQHTAGVVDIHTKSTDDGDNASEISSLVGSKGQREISGHTAGRQGDWDYFFTGSVMGSGLGIENPTSAPNAIHDQTQQIKAFGYASYTIDGENRLSLMSGVSNAQFQIPNNPNQTAQYVPPGWTGNVPSSASLNANQQEYNAFETVSFLHQSGVGLNYQMSLFHRSSTVNYQPDALGDLLYNGVAATITRQVISNGLQFDASQKMDDQHTLRMGWSLQHDSATENNSAVVFPTDNSGNIISATPQTIVDNTTFGGNLFGAYIQDEYKLTPRWTVNYGVRYDYVNTVTDAQQLSPRLGVVYEASDTTRWHAGYARYFTPPPTEIIDTKSVALFQNTTNALPSDANTSVESERSNYYDVGVSHLWSHDWTLGMDAYYRQVQHLQDEGQFGNALIFSAFNYQEGRIGGLEWTANYHHEAWSGYLNLARSAAYGKGIETGQFNFSQAELDYIANHWVHLDHDQAWTSSAGLTYKQAISSYNISLMAGTGLRTGFANTQSMPGYAVINTNYTHQLPTDVWGNTTLRLSIINLFDRLYEIRDGEGIGMGAPQWGQGRTFYVGLTHAIP